MTADQHHPQIPEPRPYPDCLPPGALPTYLPEVIRAHASAAVPILEALVSWKAMSVTLHAMVSEATLPLQLDDDQGDAVLAWAGCDLLGDADAVIDSLESGWRGLACATADLDTLKGRL